jgi:glycyl-tRNA synthetase beta chain
LDFLEGRFETVLSDQGYAVDLIESVLNLTATVQLEDIQNRLRALKSFQENAGYNEFLIAIKRVYNIIPKKEPSPLRNDLLKEDAEKELKEKVVFIKSAFDDFLKNKKYDDALTVILSTIDSINNFFDNILVMDKQEDIKENRLALLSELWSTASSIADFSKLQSQ